MNHTIIVAGGKGLRMGGDIPKQFIPVNGMPVLMHTIRRFREYDPQMHIVLVLPKDHQDYWRQLCSEYSFTDRHDIADGGSTRFHSSQNGIMALAEAPDTDIVAIHDGVRPLVSVETIGRCFRAAAESGAAIPVLPVIDTLRYVGHADENGVNTEQGHNVLRSDYRVVQTPQTFRLALLRRAFTQPFSERFTDDASVVEALGEKVTMVDGNRENIKITTPYDLKVFG